MQSSPFQSGGRAKTGATDGQSPGGKAPEPAQHDPHPAAPPPASSVRHTAVPCAFLMSKEQPASECRRRGIAWVPVRSCGWCSRFPQNNAHHLPDGCGTGPLVTGHHTVAPKAHPARYFSTENAIRHTHCGACSQPHHNLRDAMRHTTWAVNVMRCGRVSPPRRVSLTKVPLWLPCNYPKVSAVGRPIPCAGCCGLSSASPHRSSKLSRRIHSHRLRSHNAIIFRSPALCRTGWRGSFWIHRDGLASCILRETTYLRI